VSPLLHPRSGTLPPPDEEELKDLELVRDLIMHYVEDGESQSIRRWQEFLLTMARILQVAEAGDVLALEVKQLLGIRDEDEEFRD
jgi:hypothetical protein